MVCLLIVLSEMKLVFPLYNVVSGKVLNYEVKPKPICLLFIDTLASIRANFHRGNFRLVSVDELKLYSVAAIARPRAASRLLNKLLSTAV